MSLLFYRSGTQCLPLPSWASFFIRLGTAVADFPVAAGCLNVIVSVPSRLLASPFIAFGTVLARASVPVFRDKATCFRQLSQLPPNETHLSFLKGQKRVTGVFRGIDKLNGKPYLCIDVKGGIIKKPEEFADSIFISEEAVKDTSLSGRAVGKNLSCLQALLPPSSYQDFILQPRLECLIVGPQDAICSEIRDHTFYLSSEGAPFHLCDLLRVRGFPGTNTSYRTELTGPNTSLSNLPIEQPHVMVLDGALAFQKKGNIPTCRRIVILERTAVRSTEAITSVMSEYIRDRIEIVPQLDLPEPPDGIEVLAYEVEV